MIGAFAKAVAQLDDPRILRLLMISVLIALGIFIALWVGVGVLLTETRLFDIGWLDAAIDVLGGLATIVITWLLFPAVVSATVGIFLDRVAGAVEARHYPALPAPREQDFEEIVVTTAMFLAVMLAVNLAVLVFLLVPPLFPFVFVAANGYLIGREYFELVALRRDVPEAARALRLRHRGRLFIVGVVIALLLTVPFVNLLAPVIGTAAMVHIFERIRLDSAEGPDDGAKGPDGRGPRRVAAR
jgi:CysZ protein